MDYTELADELFRKMYLIHKAKIQTMISRCIRGEAFILKLIHFHGNDMLPSEISDEMGISSARIATALNSLENKGLITRRINTSDRRKIMVNLTPKGEECVEKNRKELVNEAAMMLSKLGEHDAREYVRIIGRLAETQTLKG